MSKKPAMLLGAVACALIVGSWSMAAQEVDVAGTWNLTFTSPMRDRTVQGVLTLEVDGQDLKGTFQRQDSDAPSEVTGKIEGSSISFTMAGMGGRPGGAPPGGGRGAMQITFEGTVAGDAMAGQFHVGDRGSGDWSAERTS